MSPPSITQIPFPSVPLPSDPLIGSADDTLTLNGSPQTSESRTPGQVAILPEQNDPGMEQTIQNGLPSLSGGSSSASVFAAKHKVQTPKNWDLTKPSHVLEIVREAVGHIKDSIRGEALIQNFANEMKHAVITAIGAHPDAAPVLADDIADLIETLSLLKSARAGLAKHIPDGGDAKDPKAALSAIKKGLRAFRYQTQKTVSAMHPGSDYVEKMGIVEGAMRKLQNAFSDTVVSQEKLELISTLESKAAEKTAAILEQLQKIDPNLPRPALPEKFTFLSQIGETLDISHRTNDQIRTFEDAQSSDSRLRGMLGSIAEKGGSHKVTFTAGIGALIGLGFSAAAVAGIRAGARVKIEADVSCEGADRPLEVTFRLGGGLEAKLLAKAGLFSGPSAAAGAGAQVSHFVTRSYASLDDLILDANRNKMATARSIGGAISGTVKTVGSKLGRLGTKLFRAIGRHSGDIMQSVRGYLDSLKGSGIIHKLDTLLTPRANPIIVAERDGYTGAVYGDLSGNIALASLVSMGGEVTVQHQHDFNVSSHTYAPIAQNIRNAGKPALAAMIRPFPDGVSMPKLAEGTEADDLADAFELLVDNAVQNPPAGKEQWAELANKIRTLMISVELLHTEGGISREEADRLLERFSNPGVKLPSDIYREYLMEGTGNAKPAKIRNSFSSKVKVDLLTSQTSGLVGGLPSLTGTAADSFIKAVAGAGVQELRHQLGLDNTIEYRFSSEKPAKPGEDPRPWENSVKTTHEVAVTASIPFRAVVNMIARSVMTKGGRADATEPTAADNGKEIAKDAGKGLVAKAIPKLLIAGVKEGAKAAVIKWLSNPDNIEKLVTFAFDHAGEALGAIVGALEWIVENPGKTLETALTVCSYVGGTSISSENERLKTIKWEFNDGKLVKFSVSSEVSSKIGIDVDPVGVGVGVGFDLSYKVTDSLKERGMLMSGTLTTLMGEAETFSLTNTNVTAHSGSNEGFKNYLAANLSVVREVVADLSKPESITLYAKAIEAAAGDPDLQIRMRDAHQKLMQLGADGPAAEVVDAAHDLLLSMTAAFRSSFSA